MPGDHPAPAIGPVDPRTRWDQLARLDAAALLAAARAWPAPTGAGRETHEPAEGMPVGRRWAAPGDAAVRTVTPDALLGDPAWSEHRALVLDTTASVSAAHCSRVVVAAALSGGLVVARLLPRSVRVLLPPPLLAVLDRVPPTGCGVPGLRCAWSLEARRAVLATYASVDPGSVRVVVGEGRSLVPAADLDHQRWTGWGRCALGAPAEELRLEVLAPVRVGPELVGDLLLELHYAGTDEVVVLGEVTVGPDAVYGAPGLLGDGVRSTRMPRASAAPPVVRLRRGSGEPASSAVVPPFDVARVVAGEDQLQLPAGGALAVHQPPPAPLGWLAGGQ